MCSNSSLTSADTCSDS